MINTIILLTALSVTPIDATVSRVVDGDTVKVISNSKEYTIRVRGIDCPESRYNRKCAKNKKFNCKQQAPFGKAATVLAKHLLPVGVPVRLVPQKKRGYYGRVISYIHLRDGRDFGHEMIKAGLCVDYGHKYPHPRMNVYLGK